MSEVQSHWQFDQGPNVAAICLRRIFSIKSAILVVYHDIDDDGWQFLDGEQISMTDAMLVGMGEIVKFDKTVTEIAKMPPGYFATRQFIGDKWIVSKKSEIDDDPI